MPSVLPVDRPTLVTVIPTNGVGPSATMRKVLRLSHAVELMPRGETGRAMNPNPRPLETGESSLEKLLSLWRHVKLTKQRRKPGSTVSTPIRLVVLITRG